MQFGAKGQPGDAYAGDPQVGHNRFFDMPADDGLGERRTAGRAYGSGLQGAHFAGFWIRLLAQMVDGFIFAFLVGVPLGVLQVVLAMSLGEAAVPGLGGQGAGAGAGIGSGLAAIGGANPGASAFAAFRSVSGAVGLLVYPLTVLVSAVFMSSGWQATPGKRICGIHLMRTDGDRVGFFRAIWRQLSTVVYGFTLGAGFVATAATGWPIWTLVGLLVTVFLYMMVGTTKQKTGLHDLLAGTRVVYGRL